MIDYFDGFDRIKNMKPELENWVDEFSGDITDEKEFVIDVQRQLGGFVADISYYSVAIEAKKNNKTKDYLKELEEAIESCDRIADNLRDYRNPIFDSDRDSEAFKNAQKISEVSRYLQEKRILLHNEQLKALKKEIKLLEKTMKEKMAVGEEFVQVFKTYNGKQLYKYLSKEDQKKVLVAYDYWLNDTDSSPSNEIDFSNQYNAYKTRSRSEIRRRLVLDLASTFITYTNRTTLKRTREEKGLRNKTPFKNLVEICFKAMDERLTEDALKKLLAGVHKSFTQLLVDLNIEEK